MFDVGDSTTWGVGAIRYLVEAAIKENRQPDQEHLAMLVEACDLPSVVRQYVAALVRGKRPGGRAKQGTQAAEKHMIRAVCMIASERNRAARDGSSLSVTAAIDRIGRRNLKGFGRTSLKKAMKRARAMGL